MGMTWTATCADRAHTQKPGQDRIFMDGNGQDKDRTGQGGRQGRANDKDRTDTMTVKNRRRTGNGKGNVHGRGKGRAFNRATEKGQAHGRTIQTST